MQILARVFDAAGNSKDSAKQTVTIDNLAPTGTITAPAASANVRGSAVTVSSNSADASSGVQSAEFDYSPSGANSWTAIGTDTVPAPYSVTWNSTLVTDGLYDLRVITTDNAGNTFTSASVTVRVDNTGPTIVPAITGTLGTNGWYTSNVTVSWTVTDPGGSGVATSPGCTTTNIVADTVLAGTTLTCTPTDNAGNSSTQSVTIKRDATAPTGALTAPAASANVRGAAVVVSSTATDALSGVLSAQYQWSPTGANTWTTIGTDTITPYSTTWDTTGVADGLYDLRVVTTDNASNTSTSAIRTVRVDNTAPVVAAPVITGTLGDNGWYTSATVVVTWAAATDTGGSGVATATCTATTVSTDTSGQVVTCNATDNAGNVGTNSVTIKKDAAVPTTATLNTVPAYTSEGAVLTGAGADARSGVASISYFYCAGTACTPTVPIGSSTAASTYPVAWTGLPADGSYQVLARVTDNAGLVKDSVKQTTIIDQLAPTGTLTAPADGAIVRGSITVSSNSNDVTSGVQNAVFQYSVTGANSWTTIATDTTTPYSTSWNTSLVADGVYDLRVTTNDKAGNAFTSPIVNVRVDNTAPAITANPTGTAGTNGWYVGNVSLAWTVVETGSGVASSTGCTTSSITTDTTGTLFTCTATDNAGNVGSSSITIKRDTVTPTKSTMLMNDVDKDGRVDQVVVTFSESLDSYTAGNAPWTLANVPSGGSLNSVSVSGTTATLTLNEGAGAKDTAVGSFTVALASNANGIRDVAGNRASFTATAPTDEATPVPVSFLLNNKSGNTPGKVEAGDFATVTYSEPLAVASICTAWSNDAIDQSTSVTATMTNNLAIDPLTLGSTCANFGTLNLNGDYVSSTRTFSSSTITWDVSAETLKITLGSPSSTTNSGVSSAVPTYTPTASLKDPAGNAMPTTPYSGTSSRF